jgi:hypothetical protein
VATVVGKTYTLDFLFINNPYTGGSYNAPSELLVSASNVSVPEPSSAVLMLLGIECVLVMRKRIPLGRQQVS